MACCNIASSLVTVQPNLPTMQKREELTLGYHHTPFLDLRESVPVLGYSVTGFGYQTDVNPNVPVLSQQ